MRKKLRYGEFARVFGINPRNRVIECFLEMRGLDYNIGDIARDAELNRMTTYKTIIELEKKGYLIKTRKVSGSQLYKLNEKKEEVKVLMKAFDMVLSNLTKKYEKHAKEQEIILKN